MNKKYKKLKIICVGMIFSFLLLPAVTSAAPYQPIDADNRIKTLVYNENAVFPIVTEPGYQLSIEFHPKEEILAVSMGESSAWRVTPAGTRLFIKPLIGDITTNMTVITDERAYQFDLSSYEKKNKARMPLYVVRFYYPGEEPKEKKAAVKSEELLVSQPTAKMPQTYNFDYTIAGSKAVEPTKIFDDGKKTYFELARARKPRISYVNPVNGAEQPLRVNRQGKFFVVDRVGWQFSLRADGQVTCVFNEKLGR